MLRKDYTKEQILEAMETALSIKGASRYLGCSYQHLKKWMKLYKDEKTGKTFFELYKNIGGKGVPKFKKNINTAKKNEPTILDIVNGKVNAAMMDPKKIRFRLIESGLLKEECYICGFHERRLVDNKLPLILHFKDSKTNNFAKSNTQMLCYNCYFLYHKNVFTEKEIDRMEEYIPKTETPTWEIDDYTQSRLNQLNELGLFDKKVEDDPYSLVSRK